MRQEIPVRILVSVLAIALAAALLGCGGAPPASETAAPPEPTAPRGPADAPIGPGGGGQQEQLAQLGVTGMPSDDEPRGLLITSYLPSSEPWPLQVLGVEVGDAIIVCNGQQQQIGARLVAAIDGLQERGEPISLIVVRNDERVRLERTEKFPDVKTDEEPE